MRAFRNVIIATGFTAAMVAGTAVGAQAVNVEPIAHRGVHNAKFDENSMPGYKQAVKLGAYIETDVQTTQDLKFVMVHDATLNSTTNCEGRVQDMTLAEIKNQCRTDGQNGSVPTFRQLARYTGNTEGALANVEVKSPTDDTSWFEDDNRLLRKLVAIAREEGARDQIYFSDDGGDEILKGLRDSSPKALTCWKPTGSETFNPKRAEQLSVDAVMAYDFQWKSAAKVDSFQKKGLRTWGRIANTVERWKHYKALGVGRVLTDRPAASWFDNH